MSNCLVLPGELQGNFDRFLYRFLSSSIGNAFNRLYLRDRDLEHSTFRESNIERRT